jgi:type IV secretory pathway TrbF-like protein
MTAADWSRSIEEARMDARFWRLVSILSWIVLAAVLAGALLSVYGDPCLDPALRDFIDQEVQLGH